MFFNITANQETIFLKVKGQSEQAATLHMITIREILPQFTMFGRNRHRMGTRINSSLSREVEPATQMRLVFAFYVHLLAGSAKQGLVLFLPA